jgi:alpha-glucosidase
LPWAASGPTFGFSPPNVDRTWLPQPDWYAEFAAARQDDDPASTLTLYRDALRERPRLFGAERLEWLDTGRADVLAFRRGHGLNVTVMSSFAYTPPESWGRIVLRSGAGQPTVIRGDTSAWLAPA